jgi:hypothetical protein
VLERSFEKIKEAVSYYERSLVYGTSWQKGHALGELAADVFLAVAGAEALEATKLAIQSIAKTMTEAGAGEELGLALHRQIRTTERLAPEIAEIDRSVRSIRENGFIRTDLAAVEEIAPAIENSVRREYPLSTHWKGEVNFEGNRVFQRNDLIDPKRRAPNGETNLQLMRRGCAPYGPDGERIELHHLIQTQRGAIAEITKTFHNVNTKVIHVNWPQRNFPSGINRELHDQWRENYWKFRARDFEPTP